MSLDDQNRLRCITQTQKILKNQSSYLTLLDGISPQCSGAPTGYLRPGLDSMESYHDMVSPV